MTLFNHFAFCLKGLPNISQKTKIQNSPNSCTYTSKIESERNKMFENISMLANKNRQQNNILDPKSLPKATRPEKSVFPGWPRRTVPNCRFLKPKTYPKTFQNPSKLSQGPPKPSKLSLERSKRHLEKSIVFFKRLGGGFLGVILASFCLCLEAFWRRNRVECSKNVW